MNATQYPSPSVVALIDSRPANGDGSASLRDRGVSVSAARPAQGAATVITPSAEQFSTVQLDIQRDPTLKSDKTAPPLISTSVDPLAYPLTSRSPSSSMLQSPLR